MNEYKRQSLVALGLFGGALLLPAHAQQARKKLTVVIGSTSFAWLPLYVAYGADYFKASNLDVEIVTTGPSATPAAAILSGNGDIAGIGLQPAFAAVSKNQPIRILTPMTTEYTSVIFARTGILEKKNVSAQSPIKDRVKAMAGLRLATNAIGAGPHLMYRYLFAKYGDGLDVDKDAQVLPVGDSRNTLAAIKNGSVDIAAFSPPVPQKAIADGDAVMFIDTINGDVPETRGMIYTVLAVTSDKIAADPIALEIFVRAIDRANRLIHSDVSAAGRAARSFMASMESSLFEASVQAMVKATPTVPTVSIDGLDVAMSFLQTAGYNYKVDLGAITANDLVQRAMASKK